MRKLITRKMSHYEEIVIMREISNYEETDYGGNKSF